MDYGDFRIRDLRLHLLQSLCQQPGYRCNEHILQAEVRAVGFEVSRDQVRNELRYLKSISAIDMKEVGEFMIATLTVRGKEHTEGLLTLEGVNAPQPGA